MVFYVTTWTLPLYRLSLKAVRLACSASLSLYGLSLQAVLAWQITSDHSPPGPSNPRWLQCPQAPAASVPCLPSQLPSPTACIPHPTPASPLFSLSQHPPLSSPLLQGILRIAHCGGLHVSPLNVLVRALNTVAKLLHRPIRWDTETVGCQPSLSSIPAMEQRSLVDALSEVKAWMDAPSNQGELITLFFDDQPDLEVWGVAGHLKSDLLSVFPVEWIFTRDDLEAAGSEWPSGEAMVNQGRRLVLLSVANYRDDMAPLVFPRGAKICNWTEPALKRVDPPPQCRLEPAHGGPARSLHSGSIVRISSCELEYGPLNCDFDWRGGNAPFLDEATLPPALDCGVSVPSPDLLTPGRAAAAVWSWAPGHPFAAETSLGGVAGGGLLELGAGGHGVGAPAPAACTVISASDGRWRGTDCGGEALPSACRSPGGARVELAVGESSPIQDAWVLGSGVKGACPDGTQFDLPRHPRENYALAAAMRAAGQTAAWLPMTGPGWEVDGVPIHRPAPPAAAAAAAA